MRRRHLPALVEEGMTLCGHSATVQEFRRMKGFNMKDVTCKRCLKLHNKIMLRSENLDQENKDKSRKIPATA